MKATLSDVRGDIIAFIDAIMLAHAGPAAAIDAALLFRCFGDDRPPGGPDVLTVRPAAAAAHPCGALARRGSRADWRTIPLGDDAHLVVPEAFDASYKCDVVGSCVAVRLGFAPAMLSVVAGGRAAAVSALIIDPCRITIVHGDAELDIAVEG